MSVLPPTPHNLPAPAEASPIRQPVASIMNLVRKVVEFFASLLSALVLPPDWLRRGANVLITFLLFGQPYLYSATVENLSITGSYEADAAVLLSHVISDARSNVKMSAVLLPLAFTLMQTFSSETWSILRTMLCASIMSLFISVAVHMVATSCYEAILQNPAGAARWFSHARDTTDSPFLLDPWIALSIPSACMFWSFVLFFVVTVMHITTWDPSLLLSMPPSSFISTGFRMGSAAVALSILALGLMCCLVLAMTWRRYMRHYLHHIVQPSANIDQS